MVRPLTCEEISPLFVSAIAPPKLLAAADIGVPREPCIGADHARGADGEAARRPVHLHVAGAGGGPLKQDRPSERLPRRKAEVGRIGGQMRRREGRASGDLGHRAGSCSASGPR